MQNAVGVFKKDVPDERFRIVVPQETFGKTGERGEVVQIVRQLGAVHVPAQRQRVLGAVGEEIIGRKAV